MSKTDIRKVTYTPVFDNLIDEFGLYTAAVFGRVWRYCQMERGYCHAEQIRIAEEIGVKRETVNRSLKVLVEAGYLTDTTPNRKGRTRIYKDTGKAGHIVLPEPVSEVVSLSHTKIVKTEKKEKTLQPSGEVSFSNSEIQEQNRNAEKNNGNAKELEFLNTASDEQKEAYHLARQVAGIDKAIEKAGNKYPIQAVYDLIEYKARKGDRVAEKILESENEKYRPEYDEYVRRVIDANGVAWGCESLDEWVRRNKKSGTLRDNIPFISASGHRGKPL